MTNKSSSKKHCYVGFKKPTSSAAKRRNKAKARARREARQAAKAAAQA